MWVRVSRRVFQRLLPDLPTPERCVEAYYLRRTRSRASPSGSCADANSEDGIVEISG